MNEILALPGSAVILHGSSDHINTVKNRCWDVFNLFVFIDLLHIFFTWVIVELSWESPFLYEGLLLFFLCHTLEVNVTTATESCTILILLLSLLEFLVDCELTVFPKDSFNPRHNTGCLDDVFNKLDNGALEFWVVGVVFDWQIVRILSLGIQDCVDFKNLANVGGISLDMLLEVKQRSLDWLLQRLGKILVQISDIV